MADEPGYTVKEIVDMTRQEQTAGFTRVETLLSTKADKTDLIPIHAKLSEHDGHIRTLQDAVLVDGAAEARSNYIRTGRVAFWSLVASCGAAAGAIVYAVVYVVR